MFSDNPLSVQLASPLRRNRPLIGLTLGITVIIFLILVTWIMRPPIVYRLPNRTDVSSVYVLAFFDKSDDRNRGDFVVPDSYNDAVFGSLVPFEEARLHVLTWPVIGKLRVNTNDQSQILVTVYDTGDRKGAFSVNTFPPIGTSTYYIGGSRDGFVLSLKQAQKASIEGANR